jgi:hypothetical protein
VAHATYRSGQFPPPGYPLPYPTLLRSESQARIAVISYAFSAVVSLAVGVLAVYAGFQALP